MSKHLRAGHAMSSARSLMRVAPAAAAVVVLVTIATLASRTPNAAGIPDGMITIYPAHTKPVLTAERDSNSVEVGVRFSTNQAGTIAGVRYYKSSRNRGTHTGSLWTASGQRLATATFTHERRHGWQTVMFAKPVAIAPNTTYVASYYTPTGHYAQQEWAFSKRAALGSAALRASAGVYQYGHGGFPIQTWHNAAYYVDVLFHPNGSGPVPAPSSPSSSASSTPTGKVTPPAPPPSAPKSDPVGTSSAPGSGSGSGGGGGGGGGSTSTTHPAAGVPAGTALTPYTGPSTITQDGTVIDAKLITKSLEIAAHNVVITRSKVQVGESNNEGIHVSGSMTISDSTITGADNGIGGDRYTATRVEVTGLGSDGFKLGDNVHVDQAWCHDLNPAPDAHADCGQMQAGVTNMSVTNSWLVDGRNAALFLAPDLGPSTNGPVLISNNVLSGGNYTLYCVDGNNGEYFVKNITITNNRFMRDYQYGPASINVPITASGNVWYDTGQPVGGKLN